jgi:hypothetical protein
MAWSLIKHKDLAFIFSEYILVFVLVYNVCIYICVDATKPKVVQLPEAKIVALFELNDMVQQSLLQL